MVIKYNYLKNPYNLEECQLLGKGNNGVVYMLPNGDAIKISYNSKDFIGEYRILEKVNGNKYFPVIREVGADYMIRECVQGELLPNYIRINGMNKDLVLKIIDMLKEFEKLQFKKIDIRCRDIFVQQDGSLKIIDPKKCFSKERDFPRHLSKGLHALGVLEYFQEVLKEYDLRLFNSWNEKINSYITEREKSTLNSNTYQI